MRIQKAIPTIVLSLSASMSAPMVAQSPLLENQLALIHFGEQSDQLYQSLQNLLKTDELAEMNIHIGSVLTTYRRIVNLSPDSTWALVAYDIYKRQILAQGKVVPTIEEIQVALDRAGVKSPVRVLRNFLKQHPDHLDARMHLLKHLRKTAEVRTKRNLQLNIASNTELFMQGDVEGEGVYRSVSKSAIVDTSLLEDKKLSPEQDILIWGPYAQELQTLFTNGDWWRIVRFSWNDDLTPVESCSPTMTQIYRRHLAKIEALIESYPSNLDLWHTYGWMMSIAKQGSARTLINNVVPSPDSYWPTEQALSLLIAEEKTKGNWVFLAETLWQLWPRHRSTVKKYADITKDNLQTSLEEERLWVKGFFETIWRDYAEPLLESLIKTNRIADAETVIFDTVKFNVYREFQGRAANLAQHLGRADLQTKWAYLQIPEKSDVSDMDYLNMELSSNTQITYLVLVNEAGSHRQQIETMISQGQIIDWRLSYFRLGHTLSELLRQREGWPEREVHWALFHNSKIIAHGPSLPTEEGLIQELELSRVQTPTNILRHFVSEHTAQFEAKATFLDELKNLAEQKTEKKIGIGAGVDAARMLSEEDDQAIWSEYALLYRQILPTFLEQGRPTMWWTSLNPCQSEFFIHSQIMKNLARPLLFQVEACLKRQPTDAFLWGVWISLSGLVEHRQFSDLKEILTLSPLDQPLNLPPSGSLEPLLKNYNKRSNWQGIIDVQEWRWEIMKNNSLMLHLFNWSYDMQHLLEAYLNLEKNSDANEFIRVWSLSRSWQEIKPNAIKLAEKCGNKALADQWRKL